MNIIKFVDFIKENVSDTPEEYIKMELMKLKRKIDSFFEENDENSDDIMTMSKALKKGKEKENADKNISFSDLE